MEEITGATGLPQKDVNAEIRRMSGRKEVLLLKSGGWIERTSYDYMKASLLQTIREMMKDDPLKEAINPGEVSARVMPSADQGFVQEIIDALHSEGGLIKTGYGYQALEVKGNLSLEQKRLIGLLLDYAAKSGMNPFYCRYHLEAPREEIRQEAHPEAPRLPEDPREAGVAR